MVLEAIVNPFQAEKHPWEMFFIGMLYSSVAVFLGMMIFGSDASFVIVFLTVLACFPIIYGAIKMEENKDMVLPTEKERLKEHAKALSFFMFLFFGITISFTLWYIFLPADTASQVFASQAQTIASINNAPTGQFTGSLNNFSLIFLNNMKVLVFCILFAFLYGVGAIFILVWNASVLGTAIGNFIRNGLSELLAQLGNLSIGNYFHIFSLGILRYSLHGLPEILSYFVAGMAGGIISIAMIKHDFRSKRFKNVILDSMDLIMISVILLFIGAVIEVFVTPMLF